MPGLSPTQQLAWMAVEPRPIYVRWGGASSQEALTYHGRQGPPEGILVGCTTEEALKVLAGDSGSMGNLPVSKEHRAPYLEIALLMASL